MDRIPDTRFTMPPKTLPLLLAASIFLSPAVVAQNHHKMLDTAFPVKGKASLKMQIRDGNVQVTSGTKDEIRVQVMVAARKEKRARKHFETQRWDLSVRDGVVHVITRTAFSRRFEFLRFRNDPEIRIAVTTPPSADVDVRTYDGDILVNNVDGDLQLQTSDGNIAGSALMGSSLNARASEGDITLETADFETMIARTSDGNISLGNAAAEKVEVRTYDGDIAIDDANGDLVVRTSDGNITATGLSGSRFEAVTYDGAIDLDAADSRDLVARSSEGHIVVDSLASETSDISTSDGTIFVELAVLGNVKLRASDGDIVVAMPADRAASLNLRGNRIRLDCCPSPFFEGRWEKRRVEGRLNGGGALLQANATDGHVLLLGQ